MAAAEAEHPRPWIEHYPEGITWDVNIDTTPVFEQVLAACDGARTVRDLIDEVGRKAALKQPAPAVTRAVRRLFEHKAITLSPPR